ncbi:MAG: DUF4091 domain-containing protein [Ruminococcaceae bacterium]|nr:DUF4091 domain-containing protein [Oscillospiraceae bacterium]
MKYCVLPSYVWTYPDIHSYPEGKDSASLLSLRDGYATFQLHLYDVSEKELFVCLDGFEAELYRALPIRVESCPGIEEPREHFPERAAPFFVNDCLIPMANTAEIKDGTVTLYIAIKIPSYAPDTFTGAISVRGERELRIPVTVEVVKASLPPERLDIAMGWSMSSASKHHGAKCREDYMAIEDNYLRALRRCHQTNLFLYPPRERFVDGKWEFDFGFFNRYVRKALDLGFRYFHIEGVGFRLAWDKPYIYHRGIDLLSWEGYVYLEQFLAALKKNLSEQGWLDRDLFCMGVCDEPNEENAMTFRALVSAIRKHFPDMKLYDATSGAPIYGTLDLWVPRSDEYEKHREVFDHYKEMGDKVWHYVCLFPRENGYINRFMDIPLLATRYLFWENHKYRLSGYLHWTVNDYQSDADPFLESCPRHVNAGSESILPPGDDKLIYPGENFAPYISMRLENHRESAEEYAMLSMIADREPELADSICSSVFHSFHSVEFDADKFETARRRLIKEYERLYK